MCWLLGLEFCFGGDDLCDAGCEWLSFVWLAFAVLCPPLLDPLFFGWLKEWKPSFEPPLLPALLGVARASFGDMAGA